MKAFSALLGRPIERKTVDFSDLTYRAMLGWGVSKSGATVSIDTALRVSTVLACCRVLAEGVAQLPFKLYRENGDTKTPAKDHRLYPLLWRRPNDWQTSFEWRETMMLHALLDKGGFSYISRNSSGDVLELLPLVPCNVEVVQGKDYEVRYRVVDRNGGIADLPRTSVFHLRGPSWNTYQGLEMVQQAREAIGLSIASEESLARLHSNGARPSGILSTEQKLDADGIKRIKASFEEAAVGLRNAFKTIVLDKGMKYEQNQLSPADTQTNESRQHQVEEIARAFRVFPQMIGYADKTATYASAEQFFIAHVIHSLGPWIERWEQASARDLLTADEVAKGYFAKLSVLGLLRGDAKSRAEFYASGITNGWLVRNEARRYEDLDPLEGLDEPLTPMNMATRDAVNSTGAQAAIAKAIAAELGVPHLEAKIGRVLSARNEGKLKQALDLLKEVLAQVDEEGGS